MGHILSLVSFVKAHLQDFVNLVAYLIAAASIVVKFTPTPKDDAILGKVKAFVSKYIALNPNA